MIDPWRARRSSSPRRAARPPGSRPPASLRQARRPHRRSPPRPPLVGYRDQERRRDAPFQRTRLFVDDETRLPVRYEAYEWSAQPGGEPQLAEEDTYLEIQSNRGFRDLDFDVQNAEYGFGNKPPVVYAELGVLPEKTPEYRISGMLQRKHGTERGGSRLQPAEPADHCLRLPYRSTLTP